MLAVASLAPLYLFGLSTWACFAAARAFPAPASADPRSRAFVLLFVSLGAALLFNFFLLLAVRDLAAATWAGAVLSLGGYGFLALSPRARAPYRAVRLLPLAIAGSLAFLYGVKHLSQPIISPDAAEFWFPQARKMFFNGKVDFGAALRDVPPIICQDYPKLIVSLAAQLLTVFGHWNDYGAGLSFPLVLLPAFVALAGEMRWRISYLYLLYFALIVPAEQLFNTNMDGTLALYGAVAILFLGRFHQRRDPLDLLACATALGFVTGIKNEGMLIALAVCLSALVTLRREVPRDPRLLWLLLPFLPLALWTAMKTGWGLRDIREFGLDSFSRIGRRLANPDELRFYVHALFAEAGHARAYLLLALALGSARYAKVKLTRAWVAAVIVTLVFVAGLTPIFLSSPIDFKGHVDTAMHRVAYAFVLPLLMAAYLALLEVEGAA